MALDLDIKRWCLGFRGYQLQALHHAIHVKHGLTGKREPALPGALK